MKLELSDITLVAVACIRIQETLKAIKYSTKDINFKEIKLITSENVGCDDVNIVNMDPLDYQGYNRFIVNDLYKYIDTDFALIIQDDGFVINADSWMPDFLNYDYIGAPWPDIRYHYKGSRVGNGGFSLRSKKILEAASKYNFPNRQADISGYNEDGYFCIEARNFYEEAGCKFAPLDIAKYFSFEGPLEENKGIKTFGFHGKHNYSFNNLKLRQ